MTRITMDWRGVQAGPGHGKVANLAEPPALSVKRLALLRQQGKPISVRPFPDADHGMWNYDQARDGTRKNTRIAAGFYDLMADWAKGKAYGRPD